MSAVEDDWDAGRRMAEIAIRVTDPYTIAREKKPVRETDQNPFFVPYILHTHPTGTCVRSLRYMNSGLERTSLGGNTLEGLYHMVREELT